MKIKEAIYIASILLIIMTSANAQDELSKIDDKDKTSSRMSNMFSDPATLKRAQNLGAGMKEARNVVAKGKKYKGLEKIDKEKIKEEVDNISTGYKNTKAGFFKMLNHIANKVNKVLEKSLQKVNQWQTTYPTLEAYYKVMKKWTDDTVDLIQNFKVSDMYDIERKWDRQLEGQVYYLRRNFVNFGGWMRRRYESVNREEIDANARTYYRDLFMSTRIDDYSTSEDGGVVRAYLEVTADVDTFMIIPRIALSQSGETFNTTRKLSERYYGIDEEKGMPLEMAMYDTIQNMMEKTNRTIDDERQLAAYINKKRQMLATDMVTIQQLKANTMIQYARLKLWDKEIEGLQKQTYVNSLQELTSKNLAKID